MDDAAFAMAMADYQAGRLAAAAERCRSALDRDPVDADSLHLLGVIAVDQGDHRTGIDLIRAAMAARPGFAPQFNSLGNALRHHGRLQEAEAAYRQAAALRPDSVEIESNLGFALRGLGRPREAIAHYERAASLAPEVPRVWLNLGNALAVTGRSSEAETCYRRAIALQPDSAEAIGGFGRWLAEIGRWPQAEKLLTAALRLTPGDADLWTALGAVRQELGQPDSEACYQRAIAIDPHMGAAHYNLGRLRFQHGDSAAALVCFAAAAIADPDQGLASLAACIARLPILFRSEAEVASCRAAYAAALDGLAAEASACLAPAIGRVQPFFLPYQGLDDRDLQTTYGQLACRVVAQAEPPAPLAERPGPGERIRIGIVSGFFCDHTLFKLFLEGWLTQIDRTRFEVIGFRTGNVMDQRTALCGVVRPVRPGIAVGRVAGCHYRRDAACVALPRGRDRSNRRTVGGDASGPNTMRGLGASGHDRDANHRFVPNQPHDGTAKGGSVLHRTSDTHAEPGPVVSAGARRRSRVEICWWLVRDFLVGAGPVQVSPAL